MWILVVMLYFSCNVYSTYEQEQGTLMDDFENVIGIDDSYGHYNYRTEPSKYIIFLFSSCLLYYL